MEQGNVIGVLRRRAWASRVSTGHVVMVLAGLLGALLTLTVLHAADDTTPILAAAHDIAPGTVIDDDALRVARVHADATTLATGDVIPALTFAREMLVGAASECELELWLDAGPEAHGGQ